MYWLELWSCEPATKPKQSPQPPKKTKEITLKNPTLVLKAPNDSGLAIPRVFYSPPSPELWNIFTKHSISRTGLPPEIYRHIRKYYLSNSKTFQDGNGNGDFEEINSNDFLDGNWESMANEGATAGAKTVTVMVIHLNFKTVTVTAMFGK